MMDEAYSHECGILQDKYLMDLSAFQAPNFLN